MRVTWVPAVVVLAALAAAQESRRTPTFSSQVELVTVDVVVLDGKGQLARGLSRDDFTIFEDGKPQTIASFEAFDLGAEVEGPRPRATSGPVATNVALPPASARIFVVLVDDMGLAPPRAPEVRAALTRFVSAGLRDGDELIFTTSSRDVWWSARMPEGRDDVLALVARLRGRGLLDGGSDYVSEWEAYRITNLEGIVGAQEGPGDQGPPTGAPGPSSFAPGSSLTQRVYDRFMARGVCDPRAPSLCYTQVRGRAREVDQRRRNRTKDVLSAVDRATAALTGLRGRKSLLLWTEGFLNDPDVTAVQEVAGRCREANLAVYSLDVRGLIAGLDQMGAAERGVPNAAELGLMQMEQTDFVSAGSEGLAEDTGGFALKNTNDLGGGAARVADESRVYYLLGYAPPEGKGPRDWRKLKVEVKRPGFTVRARRGYSLRSPEEIATAAPAKKRGRDKAKKAAAADTAEAAPPLPLDMARALSTAHDAADIPLRAMAYVLDARPGGAARVLVAVEADLRSLANLGGDEHPRAVLSLSIAATHRDTGKTQRLDQRLVVDAGLGGGFEQWLVSSREVLMPPGVAQARVVMKDEFLGRLGAVTLRFVVPDLAGLRLSTPILTDRVAKGKAGAAPQPVLVARREFAPTNVLYCQFQVYGASSPPGGGPQVEASYELRRRGGATIRQGSPSLIAAGAEGGLVRLLGLPLAGMEEGDYELVLRIEDKATGEARESVEPLRISSRAG